MSDGYGETNRRARTTAPLRSHPFESPLLRARVTGLFLIFAPFIDAIAVLVLPGEAGAHVDSINASVSVISMVWGWVVYRYGARFPDRSFEAMATFSFGLLAWLQVLNGRGLSGLEVTALYCPILVVASFFLPRRRLPLQGFVMATLSFVGYQATYDSWRVAVGKWMIPVFWAIIVAAFFATIRFQLDRQFDDIATMADTDSLTGASNRSCFLREATQELTVDQYVAIFVLDLDHFKEVNDGSGHGAGDSVLRAVAARLGELSRPVLSARLGGDEFAVLVVSDPREGGAAFAVRVDDIAKVMVTAIREPVDIGGLWVEVAASIGVAIRAPSEELSTIEMMQRADTSMYRAKMDRTGFCRYTPQLDADKRRRRLLLVEFRKALFGHSVQLAFQPKVNLVSNEVVGVEALARWTHPELGPISPAEFVEIAEQNGLVDQLTFEVLHQALRQSVEWTRAGVHLPIAVNVSSRNFAPDFADRVIGMLTTANVSPDLLVLEVTESQFTDDTAGARVLLERLRSTGVEIAIDDFGTGYSSLAHLRILPVNELKIDRSFVTDMDTSSESALITRSAIDLGQNLGLRVVAEGVETAEVADYLRDLGCDLAQGYFFARPLPADQLELFLLERGQWPRASRLVRP